MGERYAVYYAPERDSDLGRFGACWLGRCVETGESRRRPDIPGLALEDMQGLTRDPRRYGFHATLVPPFRLKAGHGVDDLMVRATELASVIRSVELEPLAVREIGSFIAMVPAGQAGVARLAADCVRHFHPLREEPTLAEMERRRARGLTQEQERLMVRWGYPYVFEEFRFHLTLTNSIGDKGLRRRLVRGLTDLTASLRSQVYAVREICIFHQSGQDDPFTLVRRIPLSG